jgi:mannose-1-phosphate guanylyltransferase
MQVMILAAGRSTRLGPLGVEIPKPLVPICGYPAIEFGLALCRHAGLGHAVVNVHHQGDKIRAALGDGARLGVRVAYSDEPDLLGTGGGLAQARARALLAPGPVLVMNGKIVADLDLGAVIDAHRSAPPGTVATMVVRSDPEPEQYAPVLVDETGRIVGLRGVRGPMTTFGETRSLMFSGVHVVEPSLLDRLPPAGVSDVIGDGYIPALLAGDRVQAFVMTGYFAEHSTPARYLRGNVALLRDPTLVPHPPGALAGVDEHADVHLEARLLDPVRIAAGAAIEAGATVGPDSVVCTGARVAAGAVVEGSIVWPGAVARGEVRGVVLTATGAVAGA